MVTIATGLSEDGYDGGDPGQAVSLCVKIQKITQYSQTSICYMIRDAQVKNKALPAKIQGRV